MKNIRFVVRYIIYYLKANTRHDIHSPFVFDFVNKILRDKQQYPLFKQIEGIRKEMLHKHNYIEFTEIGAGINKNIFKKRVDKIVQYSAKSSKYAQLLYKLVKYFKPETILEFGTSSGISTMYLAAAVPQSKLITMEGNSAIAKLAEKNFNQLSLHNIELMIGDFDEVLPKVLKKIDRLDFVFFDGNHRKEPTIRYFNQCLKLAHNDTIFVFDDIHWSEEMENAWKYIQSHPQVSVSIDLFLLGLVFFKKDLSKEDFEIRF